MSVDQAAKRDIPDATVARLPGYLRALGQLTAQDVLSVSSEELAHSAGVSSAKLRKDLSHLGSYGVRGVGYDVAHLTYQISRALGLTHDWPVVIVGMGNLGRALASYGGFATKGFKVVALLDRDRALAGERLDELTIQPMDALTAVVTPGEACIGVIATPAASAQDVADLLSAAGVTSILNFAATAIQVPEGVHMRKVDLSTELQILAFHEQQRSGAVSDDLLEEIG
ncbi:redox-sensing transcriptional repressor Rex [Janibacter limosus]|uniref:Redox-sensing transcriptional repressor Rex n=2 Tax=Janibacter TaxID=53457 RepID=A0A4P6MTI1_9MICO|nr:redox-sensing transcriptional repressor Rex [Janibacter limosus]QBF45125.1 redox-sensing transcriptional repressor Rex [Janibacter limosus]